MPVGQIISKDFACIRIDRQVEIPPNPSLWRLSQVSYLNPEAGGFAEQMDRSIRGESLEPGVSELL